jgi:molybdopterin-guanine dinucleotide biosynthesis protein A
MLGLILCGGKSSRMGQDKGLLQKDNTTWAGRSMEMMTGLVQSVALSVNKNQWNQYSKLFSSSILIPDNDDLGIKGPLCGILSAHILYPDADIFVLACDLPLMNTHPLKNLLTIYSSEGKYHVYLYSNNSIPEPLCGIYTSSCLSSVIKLQREGKLEKHSMKYIIELMNSFQVCLKEEEKIFFTNVNTLSALEDINK